MKDLKRLVADRVAQGLGVGGFDPIIVHSAKREIPGDKLHCLNLTLLMVFILTNGHRLGKS